MDRKPPLRVRAFHSVNIMGTTQSSEEEIDTGFPENPPWKSRKVFDNEQEDVAPGEVLTPRRWID